MIAGTTWPNPSVVATVHSEEGLQVALKLQPGEVDLVELRVDSFASDPSKLLEAAPNLKVPLIITVRHPQEGGVGELDIDRRIELFAQFLPFAAALDIETRSVDAMANIIREARDKGATIILSFHDFKQTPPLNKLRRLVTEAQRAGADIAKLATFTEKPPQLAALLELIASEMHLPLAVMGMGPLGKVSRLALAKAGSVLNYGFLDQSNASGQWPAQLLRQRIEELD